MSPRTDEQEIILDPYGDIGNEEVSPPNKTQQKVLDWWDNVRDGKHSRKGIPTLYLQGGVGCGKTRAYLAVILEALIEIPGIRILWGRQDFNDLRLSAMETFLQIIPPELIQDRSVQEHRFVIRQADGPGGQIFFKGLKDLAGLGSQEFGIIAATEAHEISLAAFRTLKMRCRQKGAPTAILLESNPPNEGHWLDNLTKKESPDFDPSVEKWEISTYENWDNLPQSYKEELELMPESWKKKFLYGKTGFIPEGKPVFPMYKEHLHGLKELPYLKSKRIYAGWDFGFHYPGVLFTQIDSQDRWFVLREILGHDILIDEFGDHVLRKMKEWFPGHTDIKHYGDPAGNSKGDKSPKTSFEILAGKGIKILAKASHIRRGVEIVSNKMSRLIGGIPAFLVSNHCPILNDALLGGYHFKAQREGYGEKEEPSEDGYYEHLSDALRYIAINIFQLRQPVNEKAVRTRAWKEKERIKKMKNAGFS